MYMSVMCPTKIIANYVITGQIFSLEHPHFFNNFIPSGVSIMFKIYLFGILLAKLGTPILYDLYNNY